MSDLTILKGGEPMKISEMTEKEILRQQLELLAEQSVASKGNADELRKLTDAMTAIDHAIRMRDGVYD